ncbi:TPA: CDP-alcohol phosphatidyltransferase family protein [Legionella feeleii]
MFSIYDIKPTFQALLRPLVNQIHIKGFTANQVTVFTFIFSILYALLLAIFIESSWLLILFPIVLFLRMAFNAIDGLLAKEHHQKTPLGAILNELTDMAADAALYLPFALYPGINNFLIIAIVVLALLSEAAGLSGLLVGGSRRYDGPMGKSDRAFIFSLLAIWLALFDFSAWINWLLLIICFLILLTIVNRVRQILQEVETLNGT